MNEYEGTLRSPCSCGLCHFQWFRNGWICPGVSRSSNEVGHDVDPWALGWIDSDPGDSEISDSWSSTSNVGYRFGHHDYHGGTPRNRGSHSSWYEAADDPWGVTEDPWNVPTPGRSSDWDPWNVQDPWTSPDPWANDGPNTWQRGRDTWQDAWNSWDAWLRKWFTNSEVDLFLLREFPFHLRKNHKISCHAAPLGTGTSSLSGTNLAPWLKHGFSPKSPKPKRRSRNSTISFAILQIMQATLTFRRLKSQISEVTEVLLTDPDPESNPCHCMLGRWFQSANSATNQTWS